MQYISTRGKTKKCGFVDAFLNGLADDGGLLVPETIPAISESELNGWRNLSYQELLLQILSYYVGDEIPREDLQKLIEQSYAGFRSAEITPLKKIHDSLYILELFHGPTFAFKDIALQLIGNLYSYVSRKYGKTINILGATSGDTGAAAIHGVKGKPGIKICILHPHQKVSRVQELQMTTVLDDNVLNLSVEGNFDDCQRIMKEIFADLDLKNKYSLRSVNSINIVRILAQTVYYFYAYFRLTKEGTDEKVDFCIPSGNFGNIYSGYLARKMGLPIGRLILATNENNILERFVNTGIYRPEGFKTTHSPAMDIQVASNFERYLYALLQEDADALAEAMKQFGEKGEIVVTPELLKTVQADFASRAISNEKCLETIKVYHDQYGYLLDPHTSCGVAAFEEVGSSKCITFSTAHPAKFDEAISQCGIDQHFPEEIAVLQDKPQRMKVVGKTKEEVLAGIVNFLGNPAPAK